MGAWKKFAAVLSTVLCGSLVLISGPQSSNQASAAETNDSNGVTIVLAEPIVELHPDADPRNPEVQQEVDELTEQLAQEMTDVVAEPAESAPKSNRLAQAGAAGFSHRYNTSEGGVVPPPAEQASIQRAINSWSAALETSAGPIVIDITWKDLGSANVLGSAGPVLYEVNGETHVAPLWNTDNEGDPFDEAPEIVVNLNSAANWNTDTSSPAGNQIDLESVVLHELGHGLGFLGNHSPGDTTPEPTRYDYEVTYLGTPYLQTANPSDALVSNNLNVNVSDSYQYRVYAPTSWNLGSSLSHFDENTYPDGSPGVLMTPSIAAGDTHRNLDAPVLGVMSQIGWDVAAPLSAPYGAAVNMSADPTVVTWNVDYGTFSYVPDKFRVDVLDGSTVIATKDVPATSTQTSFTGLPNGTWTFRITPVDQVGASASIDGTSTSVSGTILLTPSKVDYVSISGVGLTQTIDWPDATRDPDSYIVEITTDGTNWTQIGTPVASTLDHTFTEGTYQVRVQGTNSLGDGPTNTSTFVPVGTTFVRPAPLDHQIRRLYLATFLREPDEAGFNHWRYERAGNRTMTSIANHFAGSSEFQTTYGNLTNTEFVELLYQNVFKRALDPVGRATWVGLLDAGGSRGEVLARLSDSNEFIANTTTLSQTSNEASIQRLYLGYFKRQPDASGFANWLNELNSGRSLESISNHFAGSDEFLTTYGSLSNAEFVELLYFNILSREPDAQGLSDWTGRLDSGARSRGSVMTGFSESRELVILTGTAR